MRKLINYFMSKNGLITKESYNDSEKNSHLSDNEKKNIRNYFYCKTRLDNNLCDSVIWSANNISVNLTAFKRLNEEDAISFKFGGCLMARFLNDDRYYIAHIHMGQDARLDSFCEYIKVYEKLIIFRPIPVFRYGLKVPYNYRGNLEVMGVIDRNGDCYSVLIYNEISSFFVLAVATHLGNHTVNDDIIRTLNKNMVEPYITKFESYGVKFHTDNINSLIQKGVNIKIE